MINLIPKFEELKELKKKISQGETQQNQETSTLNVESQEESEKLQKPEM